MNGIGTHEFQVFQWDQEKTVQRWANLLRISPEGLDWDKFDRNLYTMIRGSGIEGPRMGELDTDACRNS